MLQGLPSYHMEEMPTWGLFMSASVRPDGAEAVAAVAAAGAAAGAGHRMLEMQARYPTKLQTDNYGMHVFGHLSGGAHFRVCMWNACRCSRALIYSLHKICTIHEASKTPAIH